MPGKPGLITSVTIEQQFQVEKFNFMVNLRVCITDINEEVGLAAVKELTEVEGFDQVSMQVNRSKA